MPRSEDVKYGEWVKLEHFCIKPASLPLGAGTGSVWQCSGCQTKWEWIATSGGLFLSSVSPWKKVDENVT